MQPTIKDFIIITKTSYLSNDSKHGFIYENLYWSTVTHFIEAKKFEGTQYEDAVRNSTTSAQAKHKTMKRNILIFSEDETNAVTSLMSRPERKIIYGNKKSGATMKSSWVNEYKNFLMIGIREKFKQNPRIFKLLISTYPKIIIPNIKNVQDYKITSITSDTLMKIRNSYINELSIKTNILEFAAPLNTPQLIEIRNVLIFLSMYISRVKKTMTSSIIVEPAIFNIHKSLPQIKDMRCSIKHMGQYVSEINNILLKFNNSTNHLKSRANIAVKICKFVQWCSLKENRLKKVHKEIDIFLDIVGTSNDSDLFDNIKRREIIYKAFSKLGLIL